MDSTFHGELVKLTNLLCCLTIIYRQLAVTTVALVVPFVLLRRQRASSSTLSKHISPSHLTSPPPVRRVTSSRIVSTQKLPTSTTGTSSAKAGVSFREAPEVSESSRELREDGFNGVSYSLKAFGIASALVVAGGAASVWGVKAYLGVKDVREYIYIFIYLFSHPFSYRYHEFHRAVSSSLSSQTQEFASTMRLTIVNKWPLLTSRIHRVSGDDAAQKSRLPPWPWQPTLESPDGPSPPTSAAPDAIVDKSGWDWPAAQSRLAAAYERGGVARLAEAAVGEMEAELELERQKRGLEDPIEGQR
jgi:hypothetical protein